MGVSSSDVFARLALFLLAGAVAACLATQSGWPLVVTLAVLLVLLRVTNFLDRRR